MHLKNLLQHLNVEEKMEDKSEEKDVKSQGGEVKKDEKKSKLEE